jgi:hypothetical protein
VIFYNPTTENVTSMVVKFPAYGWLLFIVAKVNDEHMR